MSIVFGFDASKAEELLMKDSFTKLCNVVFPIEAARAPVVMHYDVHSEEPTLIFACNAAIHAKRVTPPPTLRVNGKPTRKYAIVECTSFPLDEVAATVDILNGVGYYAYTAVVNNKTKLYVVWDEECMTPQDFSAEDNEGVGEGDF